MTLVLFGALAVVVKRNNEQIFSLGCLLLFCYYSKTDIKSVSQRLFHTWRVRLGEYMDVRIE